MASRNWSRSETLMALAFYLCPPPSRKNWDDTDLEIQRLAQAVGRSESAVCFKIGNLKSCDPNRDGKGFKNAARLDAQVMNEYLASPSEVMDEALNCLAQAGISIEYDGSVDSNPTIQLESNLAMDSARNRSNPPGSRTGKEKLATMRARINQGYFRSILMTNYNGACCLTGINIPALLVASHIKPWAASSERERVMPSNGIILNAFHDRAFDRGLITLDDNYRIVVSSNIPHSTENDRWLYSFAGEKIRLPQEADWTAWPSHEFIHYHNDCVFSG